MTASQIPCGNSKHGIVILVKIIQLVHWLIIWRLFCWTQQVAFERERTQSPAVVSWQRRAVLFQTSLVDKKTFAIMASGLYVVKRGKNDFKRPI